MASSFDDQFAAHNEQRFELFGTPGFYRAPKATTSTACTLIVSEESQQEVPSGSNGRVVLSRVRVAELLNSEVPDALIDGVVTVEGESWTIVQRPVNGHGYARLLLARPERVEMDGRGPAAKA